MQLRMLRTWSVSWKAPCAMVVYSAVAVTAAWAQTVPQIFKNYSVPSITVGGTANLTFSLSNPGSAPLSNVSVTDNLPSDQVVANATPANGCGGLLSAAPGSSTVTLTIPTFPAGSMGACTFQVTVMGVAAAALANTVTATSDQGSGTATALLTVKATTGGPAFSYPPPFFPPTTTGFIDLKTTLTGATSGTFSVGEGSTLPPGLSLNENTGELSGVITNPGTYTFTIQATTSGGTATATETFEVTIPCDCDELYDSVSSAGSGQEVNTATGGLNDPPVDLSLGGGPLALSLARHYSTELAQSGFSGALGTNWMHSFETKLAVAGSAATVTLPGGKQVQFLESETTWVQQAPEQVTHELVNIASGYRFLNLSTNLIFDFSTTGALTGIEDRNGNKLTVIQGPNGPTSVSDGLGRSLSFVYNAAGQLIKVSDQTGRSVLFGYTGTNLTNFTDAIGGMTSYSYTAAGSFMTSATRPAGNTPATNVYNANSQVQSITDSFHNTTAFSYNLNAGQTTVTDARGNQTTDTNLNSYVLTKQTDALNHSSSIAYDNNFRPTLFTDRLGNQTSVAYLAAAGYPASVTDAQGHTTTFTYAPQIQGAFTFYNRSAVTFADGTSVRFTYDALGNVVTATDQAGHVTSYTYNSRGQALTMTNPAAGVTTVTYNADGTIATSTDPAANKTTYAYDSLKRLNQVTFANGTTASMTHDALDRVLSMTNERGNVTTLVYDANGNPTRATDPLNHTATAAYDTDDRVKSITDPLGNSTTPAYDPVSSLQSVTNAAGEKTTFTYDALNRVTKVADPAGFGPSYTYDAEGRVTAIADALSNTSTFLIDQLGRATQATTPLGETYSRTFDSLGRVTSVTNPLSQVTNLSYESRGLLNGIAAPLGISVSFAHDQLGLLSGIKDPNGNNWALQHDAMSRPTSKTDPLGRIISYTYDARNRLNKISNSLGSAQWTYDAAGNLTQIQYTDGTTKTFTYDNDNRLISGNGLTLGYDAAGRLISSNGLAITRDAVGRIASIAYAPGKTVTYTYNMRGLLATVSDWVGGSIAFTYDNAARLISMTRSNGVATQYGYDRDSRIAGISESSGGQTLASIAFQRDGDGKVTSAARNVPQAPNPPQGVIGLGYDAAEQVSGDGYDSLGRVAKDSLRTYTWDLASELTAYKGADGSASFVYDGLGMRTSLTSGGTAQIFVWNYALALPSIATVQSGGADQRYYVYSPGGSLLYAIDAAGNVRHWYHFDETGSTEFLTNDAGQVTDSYGVTPYGETVTAAGSTPNPFTWLGKWGVMQEGTTGLFYMRMREYDSTSARFLSRDPQSSVDPRAVNPYQYARRSPLQWTDPLGAQDTGPYEALAPFFQVGGDASSPTPPDPGSVFFWINDPLAPEPPHVFSHLDFPCFRLPDYYTASVGVPVGIPGVGAHIDFTLDRYGTSYVGLGPALGLGANSFGGSLLANWILQSQTPTPNQVSGFLTGPSGGPQGGCILGYDYTLSPQSPCAKDSQGFGLTTPGMVASGSYTWINFDQLPEQSAPYDITQVSYPLTPLIPDPNPAPPIAPTVPMPTTPTPPGLVTRFVNWVVGLLLR